MKGISELLVLKKKAVSQFEHLRKRKSIFDGFLMSFEQSLNNRSHNWNGLPFSYRLENQQLLDCQFGFVFQQCSQTHTHTYISIFRHECSIQSLFCLKNNTYNRTFRPKNRDSSVPFKERKKEKNRANKVSNVIFE